MGLRNHRLNELRRKTPQITGEGLFFAGFTAYLTWEMWSTTMFHRPYQYDRTINTFLMLMMLLKILCYDRFTRQETYLALSWIAVSMCVSWKTGYTNLFYLALCIVGAKDVPFRKILKVYLIIVSTFMILALSFSLLSIITNLRYRGDGRIRNAFGIVYTTDFASHMFYAMASWFYLKGRDLNKWNYLISAILAALIYYYCQTRLDTGCMIILVLAFWGYNKVQSVNPHIRIPQNAASWIKNIASFSVPAAAALSFVVTIAYRGQSGWVQDLNRILSSRLSLGLVGIENYGFKVFGQFVEMIGNGGDTLFREGYNFIDCSYLSVAIRYGILWFVLLLIIFFSICRKYKEDSYMLIAIAIIALNCMIAHHIVELSYNIFVMALFARGEVCKD